MAEIIVAFSKPENGKNIKNILMRNGFHVAATCVSAAQTLTAAEDLGRGIVVCGSRFADMMYTELRECLPVYIDMLVIAPPAHMAAGGVENLVLLAMPLKVNELIGTMEMMTRAQQRRGRKRKKPAVRSQEDLEIIKHAKEILITRNRMDEGEAHHYLQKCSMENGTNLVETAQMVISLASS